MREQDSWGYTRSLCLSDRLGSRRLGVITGLEITVRLRRMTGARLSPVHRRGDGGVPVPARSAIMADLLVMLGASRDKARNLVNVAMQRQKFGNVNDLAYGLFSYRYDRVQRRMGSREQEKQVVCTPSFVQIPILTSSTAPQPSPRCAPTTSSPRSTDIEPTRP